MTISDALNNEGLHPFVQKSYYDTLQVIFQRAIAAIVGSREIQMTHEAFEYVTFLAEVHLVQFIARVHKLSGIQRRQEPSIADLKAAMDSVGLQIHELEQQMHLSSRFTDALDRLRLDIEPEPLTADEEAFFSSKTDNIKRLVPSQKRPGEHIPSWMPAFPPDHTFMATPVYSERITDPRALREKLVEEGRLAEDALRRITGKVRINDELADEAEEGDEELVEVELEGGEGHMDSIDESEDVGVSDDEMEWEREESKEESAKESIKENTKENTKDTKDSEESKEITKEKSTEENKESENNEESLVTKGENGSVDGVENGTAAQGSTPKEVGRDVENDETKKASASAKEPTTPRKHISVKLSFRRPRESVSPKTADIAKSSKSADNREPKTIKMTEAEISKFDPFGLKTTSQKFDVLAYVEKRNRKLESQSKEATKSKTNRSHQPDTSLSDHPVDEHLNPLQSYPWLESIQHEYEVAFASILRTKDIDTRAVLESEVVNWDAEKYLI